MHRFMVHEAAGKIVLVCPSSFANLIFHYECEA